MGSHISESRRCIKSPSPPKRVCLQGKPKDLAHTLANRARGWESRSGIRKIVDTGAPSTGELKGGDNLPVNPPGLHCGAAQAAAPTPTLCPEAQHRGLPAPGSEPSGPQYARPLSLQETLFQIWGAGSASHSCTSPPKQLTSRVRTHGRSTPAVVTSGQRGRVLPGVSEQRDTVQLWEQSPGSGGRRRLGRPAPWPGASFLRPDNPEMSPSPPSP